MQESWCRNVLFTFSRAGFACLDSDEYLKEKTEISFVGWPAWKRAKREPVDVTSSNQSKNLRPTGSFLGRMK